MYSVVLVVAMTAAPATPDWGMKHGSCYGNGGGCYGGGWGCGGCYGSGWGFGGCGGGWGGCHGAGWGFGGCHGGGGCHGVASVYSGCGGGFGHPVAPYGGLAFGGCCGGHQAYYTGCMGYGSYYAPAAPVGYYGMTTVGGVYQAPVGGFTPAIPAAGTAPATGTGTSGGTPSGGSAPGAGGSTGGKNVSAPGVPVQVGELPVNRAQVVVRAPASAKLFAEGQATSLTGTERVFLTPELSGNRDFQYTLKLEDGTETTTRQVVVRAGHRTVVDFTTPGEKASSAVTVNLPANAKLFVDGVPAMVAGGTKTFRTPELAKGKPFVYEFRAEVEKGGTPEVLSKKVTFNAGEPVTVDFVERTASR